ncbi:hypothetical protein ABZ319_09595 [Nocardia sp. NPDC005978]|uniref:hypothetical protein n=1 Tax=Nocardia sp. NPDC005978 TaxID=3156725 RepID=UPI0033BE7CEF
MKFYPVEPECPADFGGVEWDESFDPPRQVSAHLTFEVPLFSDLVTSYGGAFAVTEPLAAALEETDLTGFEFGPLTGEVSDKGYYDIPPFEIPPLRGLIVTGRACADDFGLARKGRLVLSERAVDFLTTRDAAFRDYVFSAL